MTKKFASGAGRKPPGASSSVLHIMHEEEMNAWQRLAVGILCQAADDARKVARRGPILDPRNDQGVADAEELHSFFHSRWCGALMAGMDLTGPELERRCGL